MRIGQNPAKTLHVRAYSPKPLGVAVLNYIPFLGGYFSEALDILHYQIASLHHSTSEFDLLVFDNGSCTQVQEELSRWYAREDIHFLLLSQYNLGKTGALNRILSSMPNELICYSDGDILFRPGWMEKTMEILDAFPSSGIVTAQPCLYDILKGEGQAHLPLEENLQYHFWDQQLATEAIEEYALGIGLDKEHTAGLKNRKLRMVENSQSGIRAVIGASHMQFVIRRGIAHQILPLTASYGIHREEDKQFNLAIDQLGFVQLSTTLPYVYHMGNHTDEYTQTEIEKLGLVKWSSGAISQNTTTINTENQLKKILFRLFGFFSRFSFFRYYLHSFYKVLFEYLAQERKPK